MNEHEVAAYLNLSVASVLRRRYLRQEPKFVKIGSLVRYRRADLEMWLDARVRLGLRAAPVWAVKSQWRTKGESAKIILHGRSGPETEPILSRGKARKNSVGIYSAKLSGPGVEGVYQTDGLRYDGKSSHRRRSLNNSWSPGRYCDVFTDRSEGSAECDDPTSPPQDRGMQNSKIEWTDHTFNPWWGCVNVSPAGTTAMPNDSLTAERGHRTRSGVRMQVG